MTTVHIVMEIVKYSEGNPAVYAFYNQRDAEKKVKTLEAENVELKLEEDTLVIYQEVEIV